MLDILNGHGVFVLIICLIFIFLSDLEECIQRLQATASDVMQLSKVRVFLLGKNDSAV